MTPAERAAFDALVSQVVPTRSTGPAADEFRSVARELAENPGLWQALLDGHTWSADGRYCAHPQCRLGGYGSLTVPFPCAVRVLALLAKDFHEVRAR